MQTARLINFLMQHNNSIV